MASGTGDDDGSSKRIRTLSEKAQLLHEERLAAHEERLAAQQRLKESARAAPTASFLPAYGGDGASPSAGLSVFGPGGPAAPDSGTRAAGLTVAGSGSPLGALEPSLEQRLAQEREFVGAALTGMMTRFSQQTEQLADVLAELSGRMAGLEVRSFPAAASPAAASAAATSAAAAPAAVVAAALPSAPLYHALGQPGARGPAARPASRFAQFAGKDGLALVTKQVAFNGGQFVPPFILGDGSLGFSEKAAKANVVQQCEAEFGIVMVFGTLVKLAVVEGFYGSSLLLGHFAPQVVGSKAAKSGGGAVESATVFAEQLSSLLEGKAAATEPLPVAGDIASTLTALSHYGDLLARLYPGNPALPDQFKAWRRYLPALHQQAPQRLSPAVLHHLVNVALAKWAAACSAWVEGAGFPRMQFEKFMIPSNVIGRDNQVKCENYQI